MDDKIASNLTFDFSKLISIISDKTGTTRQADIQNHLNLVKGNPDFKFSTAKIYENLNSIIVTKCSGVKEIKALMALEACPS